MFSDEIAMSAIATIATIEMACWDIFGKSVGLPVYRLLGGAVRDKIKAYANGWYTVERTPEESHAAAKRAIARGYRALKLDPFGAGYYELERGGKTTIIALVEAVRDAIGPELEIMLEMHGRFNPVTAIEMARELARFDPSWVEEPVPPENLAALKKASEQIAVPVATGERIHTRYDYRELLELQAADIIQPDIMHIGGILEAKEIAAWADAYYVLVAPHNVGGPVATAANLHFAASTPNFKIQEHFNDFAEDWVKKLAPGNPDVRNREKLTGVWAGGRRGGTRPGSLRNGRSVVRSGVRTGQTARPPPATRPENSPQKREWTGNTAANRSTFYEYAHRGDRRLFRPAARPRPRCDPRPRRGAAPPAQAHLLQPLRR